MQTNAEVETPAESVTEGTTTDLRLAAPLSEIPTTGCCATSCRRSTYVDKYHFLRTSFEQGTLIDH